MEQHLVTVNAIEHVTHDVLGIKTTKPADYSFTPGQATEVAINKPGWEEAARPFTFTNLPDEDHLEFIIKTYPEKKGVTNELRQLKAGDQLLVHDVWGAIAYKGEGLFIAGGAGITPFVSIFRQLEANNQVGNNCLLFANKTKEDIILRQWFNQLLGSSFVNILSHEEAEGYHHGYVNKELIKDNIANKNGEFYVCGPPPMMEAVLGQLNELGVDKGTVVLEL